MAVNYIDPGAGALSEAIAAAGSGLALKLTERQRREKSLRENPQQMQAIAAAYRRAQAAGAGPSFLEGIGVRPEFGGQILAFQPDVNERTESAMLATNAPEKIVKAQVGEADVSSATSAATLSNGLPQLLADSQVAKTLFDTDSYDNLRRLQIPQMEALGRLNEINRGISENQYQGSYFNILNAQGRPQLQADAEKTKMMLGIKQDNFSSSQVDKYIENINNIDQSTPQGRKMAFMANAFIANPGFANYLAEDEFIRLRASFSEAASGDPLGAVKFGFELQGKIKDTLAAMREVASSDLSGREKKAQLEVLGGQINNIRDTYRDLEQNGLPLPQFDMAGFDLEQRVLTGEQFQADLASLGIFDPSNPQAETYAKNLLSGAYTNKERLDILRGDLSNLAGIARQTGLSTKEQEAFRSFLTTTIASLEEKDQEESRRGTMFNRTYEMNRQGPGAVGPALRKAWELLNQPWFANPYATQSKPTTPGGG